MQTLNLIDIEDSDIKYNIITFPDGEPHIVLEDIDRKDEVDILCRITNPSELFILMQVGDILNRQEIRIHYLSILYLMSMRMDRVISFNESFSLKLVANMINTLNAEQVNILEPHSDKTTKLIDRSGNIYIPSFVYDHMKNSLVVYPDKGAVERYYLSLSKECIYCSKVRDTKTGKLSGFKIENPELITSCDKPLLIVDDLCDGGGTFAGIAAEIRKVAPDRELNIYVTHMVNPKGIKTLSENFNNVYFTNSYKEWQREELPSNVTVYKAI